MRASEEEDGLPFAHTRSVHTYRVYGEREREKAEDREDNGSSQLEATKGSKPSLRGMH